jgi:hypothetical protein
VESISKVASQGETGISKHECLSILDSDAPIATVIFAANQLAK